MQRDHLASDSLVLNTSASSKYINLPSGGGYIHNASASLPAGSIKNNRQQIQSPNKDYVQINPPAMYANPPPSVAQQAIALSSPSRASNRSFHSPTKSIGSAGSRTAMDDINGSDYVCMSGGTLTKKLQQGKGQSPVNVQSSASPTTQPQVIYQRPQPVPPLKTNYTTPANELPQAQYSTAADPQIDTIAAAKQSVNLSKIGSNSPSTTSSPTPPAGPPKGNRDYLILSLKSFNDFYFSEIQELTSIQCHIETSRKN